MPQGEDRPYERTARGGGEDRAETRTSADIADLLALLERKIREAGVSGVRILTAAELEERDLKWLRTGWAEGTGAVSGDDLSDLPVEHPRTAEAEPGGRVVRLRPLPLPIVRSTDTGGRRELMRHRPRRINDPRPHTDDDT